MPSCNFKQHQLISPLRQFHIAHHMSSFERLFSAAANPPPTKSQLQTSQLFSQIQQSIATEGTENLTSMRPALLRGRCWALRKNAWWGTSGLSCTQRCAQNVESRSIRDGRKREAEGGAAAPGSIQPHKLQCNLQSRRLKRVHIRITTVGLGSCVDVPPPQRDEFLFPTSTCSCVLPIHMCTIHAIALRCGAAAAATSTPAPFGGGNRTHAAMGTTCGGDRVSSLSVGSWSLLVGAVMRWHQSMGSSLYPKFIIVINPWYDNNFVE